MGTRNSSPRGGDIAGFRSTGKFSAPPYGYYKHWVIDGWGISAPSAAKVSAGLDGIAVVTVCAITEDDREANAEFICRACNSYDAMLGALKAAMTDFVNGEASNSVERIATAITFAETRVPRTEGDA